jgi:hypothetical protein
MRALPQVIQYHARIGRVFSGLWLNTPTGQNNFVAHDHEVSILNVRAAGPRNVRAAKIRDAMPNGLERCCLTRAFKADRRRPPGCDKPGPVTAF